MNKTKHSLIFYLVTVLLVFALLCTTVFAWFYFGDDIDGMKYSIMKINSSVSYYLAEDDNHNGVPNSLPTLEKAPYYMEKYKFKALNLDTPALSEDTAFNLLTDLRLEHILPSEIYTVKYSLLNKSSVSNRVSFIIQKSEIDNPALFSTLSFQAGYVSSADVNSTGEVIFGEKIYGKDFLTNSSVDQIQLPVSQTDVFIKGTVAAITPENYGDFWLRIEMEPYEELAASPAFTMTKEEYNALAGTLLHLPFIHINFEILEESTIANK